ncbi:hypothetical protein [Harenicola maris]
MINAIERAASGRDTITIIDWCSRKVLAWRISNPLKTDFCV